MKSIFFVFCLCSAAITCWGQDTAESSFYSLRGTPVSAGGKMGGTSTLIKLRNSVGQSSPQGTATSASFTLNSGLQLPELIPTLFAYALGSGWNLLGCPGTSRKTIGEIFRGKEGYPNKVGTLNYYNGELLCYEGASDDDYLPANRGFWVFSYWGGTTRPFSVEPSTNTIVATSNSRSDEGTEWLQSLPTNSWILCNPRKSLILPEETNAIVWSWNRQKQAYDALHPGATLSPLEGYWIYRYNTEDESGRE